MKTPSLLSHIITATLKLIHFKAIVEKTLHNPPRTTKPFVPPKIAKSFVLHQQSVHGKALVTLMAHEGASPHHLLFFHGGAYVLEMSALHWDMVSTLAKLTKAKVSVIEYPLAPQQGFRECYAMVEASYAKLVQMYPQERFVFVGDSAGGGLALGFSHYLAQKGTLPLSARMVLLSPWIDLTLSHPRLPSMEALDVMLPLEGLRYCAGLFSQGESLAHPMLSPLYGDFAALPPTVIFYGTHELFYPDIERLRAKAVAENLPITFFAYAQMPHDWVLLPLIEAKRAMAQIVEFIEKNEELTP